MIEINNLTKFLIDEESLKWLGGQILAKEGLPKKVEISIALINEKEIQKINKIYRNKNEPTDVLSFKEDFNFTVPSSKIKQLGEMVICPSQITGRDHHGIEKVFIHGLLHLLGYTHQLKKEAEIMELKQKDYLTLFIKKYGSA